MGNRDELAAQINPFAMLNRAIGDGAPESVIPDNALIPQGEGFYTFKRFTMTPVGMEMPDNMTGEEWREVGAVIRGLETSIQWIVGDWFAAGKGAWGETYPQVAADLGYEVETLYTYASVCRAVQTSIRNRGLSFAHHRRVQSLDEYPDFQRAWLDYAVSRQPKKLTDKQLQEDMRVLELKSMEDQAAWLRYAFEQSLEYRFATDPDLKRPALPSPAHIDAAIIERQDRVKKKFHRLNNFVSGKLHLTHSDLQREGREIIEWVQRVMNSQES